MNKKMLAAYLLVTTFSVCAAMQYSDFAQDCQHSETSWDNVDSTVDEQNNMHLLVAAKDNNASLFAELINQGVVWQVNQNNETPFHIAAQHGACDVLRIIINMAANNEIQPDVYVLFLSKDKQGRTALQTALENNQQDAIALLEEYSNYFGISYTCNLKNINQDEPRAHSAAYSITRTKQQRMRQ